MEAASCQAATGNSRVTRGEVEEGGLMSSPAAAAAMVVARWVGEREEQPELVLPGR
jgi:hypothetical protein